jgi:hypothetical protein
MNANPSAPPNMKEIRIEALDKGLNAKRLFMKKLGFIKITGREHRHSRPAWTPRHVCERHIDTITIRGQRYNASSTS